MAFDPQGGQIDEKQLKWGYWWVTHKLLVRKIFTIVLGIVGAMLVLYASFGFIDWFFLSGVQERYTMGQIRYIEIPLETWRKYGARTEPIYDNAIVLTAGDGQYDIFARATNPNDNWLVEFDYRFVSSSTSISTKKGFLLPGETKNLHALGVKAESRPASPELEITNFKWVRIDPHKVFPDYRTWATPRLNLLVKDVEYSAPKATDTLPISRVNFTIENDTGFSYYTVGFFVTLLSGQKIVGVNHVTISDLRAGERRDVEATWFNSLPNVSRVEVAPEVNILDDTIYIPPGQ